MSATPNTPPPRPSTRRDRQGQWVVSEAGLGQTARLSSVDVTLSVDDVYRNPLGA